MNPAALVLLLALLGGGGVFAYLKLVKNKPKTKGNDSLDDYDYGEEDSEEDVYKRQADSLPVLVNLVANAMPFRKGIAITCDPQTVINDKKVTDHHAVIPVSYTHLDVYKRQKMAASDVRKNRGKDCAAGKDKEKTVPCR